MERVAIYLRKSRAEEQAGVEETLERHKKTLMEYAQAHHMVIDERDIYEEVVSGENLFARPQMVALLQAVDEGQYDAVLCMDIDRLGRGGMRDQGMILDAFKYSDTKIITPDKVYDLSNEIDETTTELKAFISRQEYKQIRKRLRTGLQHTIAEGGYVANEPYGYTKVYKNKRPTLEINETEAYFVRLMFDLYVNQGLGCLTIANMVTSMGARPHRAAKFSRESVKFILRNPVYIGKVVWDRKKHIRKGAQGNAKHITIYQPKEKWTIVDGHHPAIIEEDLFDKAQKIMDERWHPPISIVDRTVLKNSMAGLVRCGVCGELMQRAGKGGDKYLLCTTKGCAAGTRFHLAESALLDNLAMQLHEIEVSPPNEEKADISNLQKVLTVTRAEKKKLNTQKENLYDLLEQGVYDIPTYKSRMQAINAKIDALAVREAAQVKEIEHALRADKKKLAHELRNVLEVYDAADPGKRNELLKSVVDKVEYYKKKKTAPLDFLLVVHLKQF